jgi:hypothetical protein
MDCTIVRAKRAKTEVAMQPSMRIFSLQSASADFLLLKAVTRIIRRSADDLM